MKKIEIEWIHGQGTGRMEVPDYSREEQKKFLDNLRRKWGPGWGTEWIPSMGELSVKFPDGEIYTPKSL